LVQPSQDVENKCPYEFYEKRWTGRCKNSLVPAEGKGNEICFSASRGSTQEGAIGNQASLLLLLMELFGFYS